MTSKPLPATISDGSPDPFLPGDAADVILLKVERLQRMK
jgi:hypothetical protein